MNKVADTDTQLPDEMKCVRSSFTNHVSGHIFVPTLQYKARFLVLGKLPAKERTEEKSNLQLLSYCRI